jgi:hypothetical protein
VGAVVVRVADAPHEEDDMKGRRPVTLLLAKEQKAMLISMWQPRIALRGQAFPRQNIELDSIPSVPALRVSP